MKLRQRDQLDVVRDGEEIEVYNWVNVSEHHTVRGGGEVNTNTTKIGAGDGTMQPDAVTHWVAEELWEECSINVVNRGIRVVDVESEEVDVL